jgi:hypothetical protein
MKQMKWGVLLLALLLAAMVIVPMVNAYTPTDKEKTIRNVLPDINSEDFNWLFERNVSVAYGNVPVFQDAEAHTQWNNKLSKTLHASNAEFDDILYPKGPVFGDSINYLGCIEIYWLNEKEIDPLVTEKIYQIIDHNGKMQGIDKTPVLIIPASLVKSDISRSDQFRPIIGGVQMAVPVSGGTAMATTSFSATDGSGYSGYVITGHLPIVVGQNIYQPTTGYSAGTVSSIGGNYADAAFVRYSNVEGTIYDTLGNLVPVKSYSDAYLNQWVLMSGIFSQSSGQVTNIDGLVYSLDHGHYFYDQHIASYSSVNGDSGAPVYWKNSNHDLVLGGVHWAHNELGSIYSPISAVRSDLGITPITR